MAYEELLKAGLTHSEALQQLADEEYHRKMNGVIYEGVIYEEYDIPENH